MIYENEDGTFSIGVHIEKGLEKAVGVQKDFMMDHTWVWHEFLEAVKSGEVEEILCSIYENIKNEVQIGISAEVPEFIEKSFKIKMQDGKFIDEKTGEDCDLKLIPERIKQISGIEWFWVDFFITFTFKKRNQAIEGELSEYEIVKKLLEPLEKWIR